MPETSTKKQLSATVYYLLAGLIFALPSLICLDRLLPEWQTGSLMRPLSLTVIHALMLGTMLTVAFGVLYQIVPIAFQAPPLQRHVLFWHLPIHTISVLCILYGFLMSRGVAIGCGGLVLLGNAAAYFVLLFRSYLHARNKTPVHKALAFPFLSLWLVIIVGIIQAWFPATVSERLLLTHVLLGGLAFWGGLVMVLSYKLIPMFSISHGYRASLPRTASLYFTGILMWLVTAWAGRETLVVVLQDIARLLILLGLASFVVDIIAIVKSRKRRRMVPPVWEALAATGGFVVSLAWVVLASAWHTMEILYPAIFLFGFGGLLPLIYSYVQKIVPFLWFEYRFSKRPERKTAPLIDDMVPKRTAKVSMTIYYLGVIAGLIGFSTGPKGNILAALCSACTTIGTAILFMALRHVLTIGGRRPDDAS